MAELNILVNSWSVTLAVFFAIVNFEVASAEQRLDAELISASGYNELKKVEQLLARGANVNAVDDRKLTPLMAAVSASNADAKLPQLVQLLIDRGANLNAVNSRGESVLAVAHLHQPRIIETLLNAGAKPDSTAFERCCQHENLELIDKMLDAGADPTVGLLCLHASSKSELVKLLLSRGANVKEANHSGASVLHSCALGDAELIKLVIQKGASPNVQDTQGNTPLHNAIEQLSDEQFKKSAATLVELGADVTVLDNAGFTPARRAAQKGYWGKHKWFVERNGGIEPRPKREVTAKQVAEIPRLLDEFFSKNSGIREAAHTQLIKLGDSILPALIERMRKGDFKKNGDAFELLVALGPDAHSAIPLLTQLMADPEQSWPAAVTLRGLGPDVFESLPLAARDRGAAAMYECIIDPSNEGGYMLVRYFAHAFGEASVPYFLELLRHDNPAWRAKGAQHLDTMPFANAELQQALLKLLKSDEYLTVRGEAAKSSGNPLLKNEEIHAELKMYSRMTLAELKALQLADIKQVAPERLDRFLQDFQSRVQQGLLLYEPETSRGH